MNPVTRFFARRLRNRRLRAFVHRWDALEALLVRVYRAGAATPGDQVEYRRLRAWLRRHYPRLQPELERYWRQSRVGRRPASSDPFERLLRPVEADAYSDDWEAMQTLPAAREALNLYLSDLAS